MAQLLVLQQLILLQVLMADGGSTNEDLIFLKGHHSSVITLQEMDFPCLPGLNLVECRRHAYQYWVA